MKTFAVINGNFVSNVIIANTKEDAELVTNSTCVEYTEDNPAGIGWTYNGINFVPPIMNPPIEEPTE